MKRRIMGLCAMALCCLLALCACKATENTSIVGTWKHDVQDVTYAFNENGSLEYTLSEGTTLSGNYTLDAENKLLTVYYTDLSQQCTYELNGDQLVLTDTSTLAVTTLTRVQ